MAQNNVTPMLPVLFITTLICILCVLILFKNRKQGCVKDVSLNEQARKLLAPVLYQKFRVDTKPERPVFLYVRFTVGNLVYDFFQARERSHRPVIIVPPALCGPELDVVVRATLSFHLQGRDVYVLIGPGAAETLCKELYGQSTVKQLVANGLEHLLGVAGECDVFAIGSGWLQVVDDQRIHKVTSTFSDFQPDYKSFFRRNAAVLGFASAEELQQKVTDEIDRLSTAGGQSGGKWLNIVREIDGKDMGNAVTVSTHTGFEGRDICAEVAGCWFE